VVDGVEFVIRRIASDVSPLSQTLRDTRNEVTTREFHVRDW